ncbi:MAG: hypothetical protein RIA64_07715 [Rhodospirillales bacterium]
MTDAEHATGLSDETRAALVRLEELDRVLPRALEDWVVEREREGLHVPENLKRRLAEKERLRTAFRKEGET